MIPYPPDDYFTLSSPKSKYPGKTVIHRYRLAYHIQRHLKVQWPFNVKILNQALLRYASKNRGTPLFIGAKKYSLMKEGVQGFLDWFNDQYKDSDFLIDLYHSYERQHKEGIRHHRKRKIS